MDWLVNTIKRQRSGAPPQARTPPRAAAQPPAGEASEEDILTRWLDVEDGPDDDFLASLEDFSLDVWDHRTHLRWAGRRRRSACGPQPARAARASRDAAARGAAGRGAQNRRACWLGPAHRCA